MRETSREDSGSGPEKIPGIDVHHVARLAMLEIDSSEAEKMQRELQTILEHMKVLFELDVENVEPSFGSFEAVELRLLPDVVTEGFPAEEFLRGAPAVRDRFVVVPRGARGQRRECDTDCCSQATRVADKR